MVFIPFRPSATPAGIWEIGAISMAAPGAGATAYFFAGGFTCAPAPLLPSSGISTTAIFFTISSGTCSKYVLGSFGLAIGFRFPFTYTLPRLNRYGLTLFELFMKTHKVTNLLIYGHFSHSFGLVGCPVNRSAGLKSLQFDYLLAVNRYGEIRLRHESLTLWPRGGSNEPTD